MTVGLDIVGTKLSIRFTVDHCNVEVWDLKQSIQLYYGVPFHRQMLFLLPADMSTMPMNSLETLASYGITDGMMNVQIQLVLAPPPPGPDGYPDPVPITVSFKSVQPEFANWWEADVTCWEHSTVAELQWRLLLQLRWMDPPRGVEIYRGLSDRRVNTRENMGLQITEFLILDSTILYVVFSVPRRRGRRRPLAAAGAAAM